jgi:hypothetical protein
MIAARFIHRSGTLTLTGCPLALMTSPALRLH